MATAISIKNVTKTFGSKRALDKVSLTIQKGHIFGFLGPNGAGKTTMIRCLMDYIRTTSGEIHILGHDAHDDSADLKNMVGYLSSDMQLHDKWTASTHIDFIGSIKGRGWADELVKRFNLDTNVRIGRLSSGNKQKLAIILAFLGDPKLLIMDEPTRGLDPLLQNELYKLLKEFSAAGGSVFLSSHNLSEVQQLCDSVAVIKEGKLVASEAMKDILQMTVHIVQAVTKQTIDQKEFQREGVEILGGSGNNIRLKTRGCLDFIAKTLSKYQLVDLEISHVSLEDVFMEYY